MSHTYVTNAADVGEALVKEIQSFGFRSTHEGRALGEIIVEEIAEGIAIRSTEQQMSPSAGTWPENSDNPAGKGYRSRKKKKYGTDLVNERTGQMLSIQALKGEVKISDRLIEMRYGSATCPQSAKNGATLTNQDATTMDIVKAFYAERQGRGFYELDQDITDKTFNSTSEALGQHLANPGR